jgi:acyl dehydratase
MPPITAAVSPGDRFTGRDKTLSYERLWAFSGGPFAAEGWPRKNLHTDPGTAQRVGLPAAVASGTQFQGHAVELLVELFGPDWLSSGSMDVKFVRGVPAGETLHVEAVVVSVGSAEGGTEVLLDISCVNTEGRPALVGSARGLVP